MGEFKPKRFQGQELPVSVRHIPTVQPEGIQETGPVLDIEQAPQGKGAFRSFQVQEHPVSIRRTQHKDASKTSRQVTQNHVGRKVSRIQARAGTKIKSGEGGTQSKH